MIWLAILGSVFGLLFIGAWIAIALGLTGMLIMYVWGSGTPLLASAAWSALNMYVLTAIPAFLFMGQIILRSGISARIYDSLSPLLSRLPGKLLHCNIAMCAMLAAVFGTSTACSAAVGIVAVPEMRKRKYDERLLLGSICVAGTLGIMIPPSSAFIIYGAIVEESVAALFAAGTIPGIILAALFMVYLIFKGLASPEIAPGDDTLPLKESLRRLIGLWPMLILMASCVGPIYAGWATPTESAGIGAVASIVVGSTVGRLKWKDLWISVRETASISGMLFFIMLGAMILASSVSTLGLPRAMIEWVGNLQVSPTWILTGIFLMYIILGCFLDGISIQLMTLPFVYPIIQNMGFNKLWFGVIMVLLVEIALVTPPMGMNLFVVQGIGGPNTSVSTVFRGSLPFLWCAVILMTFLAFVPGLVTWLPGLLGLAVGR